jgi:hypothetical protein
MASRAHVFPDHPFGRVPPRSPAPRPRRDVWYRDREDDPIELPRSSLFRLGGGLLLALAAGAAIVAGSALASSHTGAPSLSPTPALPLVRDWQPDADFTRANITNQLSGPALAVPDRGVPTSTDETDATDTATPMTSELPRSSAAPARAPSRDDIILDDRVLNPPLSSPPVPYPNPTTTPPDGIAPPDSAPQTPTPTLDPDNPYRESTP